MIDDLPRDEAERLLSLTKFGDPSTGWRKRQETVSSAKCVFGVTDAHGSSIQGISARLSVRYGRRPPFRRFVFGIYHGQHQRDRRAYQLEIFQGSRPITDLHRILTNMSAVIGLRAKLSGPASTTRARYCSSARRLT
jgi:hypothetical protein